MGFDCIARTHVGLVRKLNEDSVLNGASQRVWAVADGMGGHDAGEIASAMITEALGAIGPADNADALGVQALAVLQDVNVRLLDMARRLFERRTIGSTVVGLVADDESYVCFWAGDSRAYLLRDGAVVQLTRDHSLVQDLVDAGILNAQEAENHPNANVITRAVGVDDVLKVDTVEGELRPGDIFLIASDGLTRFVDPDILAAELANQDLENAADRLISLTLALGAPDNVSFVIIRVQSRLT
jgi:serine/threonine protein phosphatase Stp1